MHCIRTFGLLAAVERQAQVAVVSSPPLICTGFVAHHELNSIADEVASWQACGLLRVEDVPSRSPASLRRRSLRQAHPGMDKGETEMLAWILACSPSTPFVSCDARALMIATAERVFAWDVLDLVHEWLACGLISMDTARECLAPWNDDPKARWRPKKFQGIEPTLRSRYESGYLQPLEVRSR